MKIAGREPEDLTELERLRLENADLRAALSSLDDALSPAGALTWVFALEGSRDGVWTCNLATGDVFASRRCRELLGFADDEVIDSRKEWGTRVHPDDLASASAAFARHLEGRTPFYQHEHRVPRRDGSYLWVLSRGRVVAWSADGKPLRVVGTYSDITARKEAELQREHLLAELQEAQGKIRMLKGLLPICAGCKNIRDEQGEWRQLESYFRARSDVDFSHALCPECTDTLYPGIFDSRGA